MINRIIGKRMRMLRKSLNLTQKQFALSALPCYNDLVKAHAARGVDTTVRLLLQGCCGHRLTQSGLEWN